MLEPIRWHSNHGYKTGVIVKRGPKFLTIVTVRIPIKLQRVPKTEERFMRPLVHNGQPYPPKRIARKLLKMGKRVGITKGAKLALRA